MSTTPDRNRTTHTPGPWNWQVGDECISAENGQLFIAWLPSAKSARVSRVVKADARLIAAAPDLIEACQALLRAYEIVVSNGGGSFSRHFPEAAGKGYAAVRKAEGQ